MIAGIFALFDSWLPIRSGGGVMEATSHHRQHHAAALDVAYIEDWTQAMDWTSLIGPAVVAAGIAGIVSVITLVMNRATS
jgi:hypothetical protein